MIRLYLIGFVLNLLYMAYVCLYKDNDGWKRITGGYSPNVTAASLTVLALFYPFYYLFKLVRYIFVRK
ncbi:hypothetical protein PQC39_gp057 [Vibrio phage Vp_R1]|uniref:Uncharacterized protein n=1 Tax=Vibrio phage Vp_R1 TaxID=2059867 RepID=A0A2H5BQ09_9CAUD|nr:hypothetical protein PQC39_gp057 [Vibrio phage Vp_R1]AUG88421.1 hypothetical protein VPR_057 [Vibrio phage Vp_R1]